VQLDELDEPACRVQTQCSPSSKHTSSHSQRYQSPTRQSYHNLHAVSVPAPSKPYPPLLLCRLENGAAQNKYTIYGLTPQHKAHSSSAVRKQSGDRHQRRLSTFPPHTRSSWMSLMSLRAEYGPNAQHHPIIHPRIRKCTRISFLPLSLTIFSLLFQSLLHPHITLHYCFVG